MADELGISPSYLNHLERNQRPVTAALLLRLAEAYDIDVRAFAAEGGGTRPAPTQLAEIFSDPMLADLGVPRYELVELADNAPSVADGIARLYAALKEAGRNPSLASDAATRARWSRPRPGCATISRQHRNHYPELEEAAETLGGALERSAVDGRAAAAAAEGGVGRSRRGSCRSRDARQCQPASTTRSAGVPDAVVAAAAREPHLRPRLPAGAARVRADASTSMVDAARAARRRQPPAAAHEPRQLCRRRDHDALRPLPRAPPRSIAMRSTGCAAQFGANVEQVAHRLTTLGRPGARGVPFFMLRVDPAGNISKRYAGENFPFSRFGGTCPRWNLHAAFQTPGQTITPADRDARRPALLHHQPDDRAADPARPARRRPAGDRPRLRRQACAAHRLCRRARPGQHAGDAGRPGLRDLPAAALRLSRDRRRPGGCWRSTENRKTISPFPFVAELGRDRLPLERGAVPLRKVGARPRRSIAGTRRASAPGSSDARTSA